MSEIKVNKISPRSGTTVTLGDSGDTFTIPSGATINNQGTATNFGATGSASWVTTVKTSTFTAVAGEGYFVNTTGGAVTVNLPAGTAGAVVAIKDYANTFDTNAVTLVQNGSDKIGGSTVNATLDVEGIAVTLVFIDSTQGWLVTDSGLQDEAPTATYISATGGTITNSPCGNYKIHTFTGPGTFAVSAVGNPEGSDKVDYLVAAGGGSGASTPGGGVGLGGAGAGGLRFYQSPDISGNPAAPLNGPTALPVAACGSYPVTVGAGGVAPSTPNPSGAANNGNNSVFAGTTTITSAGGGYGANDGGGGADGGSGGGNANNHPGGAGSGNTPPVSPSQGNDGGPANPTSAPGWAAGGGGGALAVGGTSNGSEAGAGGVGGGFPENFVGTNGQPSGSFRYFSGGGGGGSRSSPPGPSCGGLGGGGAGIQTGPGAGTAGTVNTGGGAGGGAGNPGSMVGATGGSGIVIIRYKFQN
jgi:hypothetical protein